MDVSAKRRELMKTNIIATIITGSVFLVPTLAFLFNGWGGIAIVFCAYTMLLLIGAVWSTVKLLLL